MILSKRTIHFTKDQMYWQCHKTMASEDGYIQQDEFVSVGFSLKKTGPLDLKNRRVANEYWWTWIRDYSTRGLTKGEDWLVAIAGVTQYFSNETGLTPCLGLWEQDLIHQLGWQAGGVASHLENKEVILSGIPTWTWFHRRYRNLIEPTSPHIHLPDKVYTKVDNVDVCWTDTPLTSRIRSTSLILSGLVKNIDLTDWKGSKADYSGLQTRFSGYFLDDPSKDSENRDAIPLVVPCLALSTYFPHIDSEPDSKPGGPHINAKHGLFLILRKIDFADGEYPKYERIGAGKWYLARESQDIFEGIQPMAIELV
jgi:hypothetical protein